MLSAWTVSFLLFSFLCVSLDFTADHLMQFFARKFGSFFAFVQRWQTCTVFTLMALPSYFLIFSCPPLVPIPRLGNWETDVSLWARMPQGQQFLKSGPETWNMHVGRPAIFRDKLQACNYIKRMKETVQIIESSWTKRRIRSKSQNDTWICQSCSNLESLNCIGHRLPHSIEFLLCLCYNCCRRTSKSQNYHRFDHAIVGNILRGISSGIGSLDWVPPLPQLPLLQELLQFSLVFSTMPMTSTFTLSSGMCWWNSLHMTSTLTLSGAMCWPNSCTGDLYFGLISFHVLVNWLHTWLW